jgi:glycosyltransferase involved in cell wall biosynthesis
MNIVFATHSYYPKKNGVQAVVGYLAEGLAKKEHTVTVLTQAYGDAPSVEQYKGVHIKRIKIGSWHGIKYGEKKKYRELINKITENADVLICVCLLTPETDFLLDVLVNIKCKKILYVHGMPELNFSRYMLCSLVEIFNWIYKNLLWRPYLRFHKRHFREFDVICHLHNQDSAFTYFEKLRIGRNISIMNAADDDFFKRDYQLIEDLPEKYAIDVANYSKRKNQLKIMRAFYMAKTNGYSLIFIGSKKNRYYKLLKKKKKQLARMYGEKDVRLYYNIARNLISSYVGQATFALQGSTWEAFPISIIECMAAGKPFISTDVGIVRYLPGGIIMKTENEFAHVITEFIDNERLRKELGEKVESYASLELTIGGKVNQLESIIQEI